jgi:hypothetical protein
MAGWGAAAVRAALAGALLVLGSLAPAVATAGDFEWDVPGIVHHVDVAGTQEALGIPMKLHAVTSSWKPDALFTHFVEQFKKAGFFIPPPSGQTAVHGAISLTALDVDRLLAYSVIMRPNPDGKTTKVLLGTANVGQIRKPEDSAFLPVYPGAENLVTVNVEVGKSLSYITKATQQELQDFYREAMPKKGYTEKKPGLFRKGNEAVEVLSRPREGGGLSVIIMGRNGSDDDLLDETR